MSAQCPRLLNPGEPLRQNADDSNRDVIDPNRFPTLRDHQRPHRQYCDSAAPPAERLVDRHGTDGAPDDRRHAKDLV